jgi:UDP-N-acetylglucosamine--N-acetylmuramyl-(pentapeptide) pyrophosphoryl-undecaprenol N-acetylglucosamine transferase
MPCVPREPEARILVLGTREGLEARLVPERGYELLFVDKVPFPRRPNKAAAVFPARFRRAIAQVRAHIRDRGVEVVVGFGGYASAPAYVAARGAACRSWCTRPTRSPAWRTCWARGARSGVGVAFEGHRSGGSRVVGMPLRREIVDLDRDALRAEAAVYFGLDAARPTLLVFGGSLGAQRLNEAFGGAWRATSWTPGGSSCT